MIQHGVKDLVAALLALTGEEREEVFSRVTPSIAQVRACKRRLADPVNWMELVGTELYDQYGRLIAVVRNVEGRRGEPFEITTAQDTNRQFIPGLYDVRIEAVGVTE